MIGEAGFEEGSRDGIKPAMGKSLGVYSGDSQSLAPNLDVNLEPHLPSGERYEGAVARLWDYCEASEGEMKLILPDTVRVPFYLPQPRAVKDPEKEMERQRRILENGIASLVCDSSIRGNKVTLADIGTHHHLSSREQRIEARLMAKFRANPELAKGMITKFRNSTLGKQHGPLKQFSLKDKENTMSLSPRRHETAQIRRAELDAQLRAAQAAEEAKWRKKVKRLKAGKHEAHGLVEARQASWIVVLSALVRVQRMHATVARTRDLREQNYRKWNSAISIQRLFRNFLYNVRQRKTPHTGTPVAATTPRSKESAIEKIKRNMLNSNQVVHTFRERQGACVLMLSFLRLVSKTWKSILLGFVRKVRVIQRRYRRHREFNTQRVELLGLYLEAVYPAYFAHSQLVLSGKGEDLQNLLAIDTNRLHETTRSLKRFSAVEGLLSQAVHAMLRSRAASARLVSRFFGPAAKLHLYDISAARRQVILQFLFKKRYQFVSQSAAMKRSSAHAKKFSQSDVRGFIRSGTDPLQAHLAAEKALQDAAYAEYRAQKTRSKAAEMIKKFTLSQVMLCLFTNITAEELVRLFLQITDKANEVVLAARERAALKSSSSADFSSPRRKPSNASGGLTPENSDGARRPPSKEASSLASQGSASALDLVPTSNTATAPSGPAPPPLGPKGFRRGSVRAPMERIESFRGVADDDDDDRPPVARPVPKLPPHRRPSIRDLPAPLGSSTSRPAPLGKGRSFTAAKEEPPPQRPQPQPPAGLRPSRLVIS